MEALLITLAVLLTILIISAFQGRLSQKKITLQQVTNIEFIQHKFDTYAVVTYGNNSTKEIRLELTTDLQMHINFDSIYVTYFEKR